jgi:hypothetical protein
LSQTSEYLDERPEVGALGDQVVVALERFPSARVGTDLRLLLLKSANPFWIQLEPTRSGMRLQIGDSGRLVVL